MIRSKERKRKENYFIDFSYYYLVKDDVARRRGFDRFIAWLWWGWQQENEED